MASRTERRDTENSSASWSKLGRMLPGFQLPETMRRPIVSAAASGR